MKTLLIALLIYFFITFVTYSCTSRDERALSNLNSPVIVISKGKAYDSWVIIVKDKDGLIRKDYCHCYESINPGDTLK